MAFNAKTRQRIIDDYLNMTGRNVFSPGEFVDWLADQSDHPAYAAFYTKSDAEAAREYRIDLARRFISGLRVVYREEVVDQATRAVTIVSRELPAFISPRASRQSGGGYAEVEASDPAAMDELRQQGQAALRSWLARYRGAFEAGGVDLSAVEAIASAQSREVVAA